MNQRLDRLDQLAVFLRDPALHFIEAAKRNLGLTLLVTFTWRSVMEQHRLYTQGREYRREESVWVVTDAKKVVTNARPGASPHNVVTVATGEPASMALDVIPLHPDGSCAWDTPHATWIPLWDLAWRFGLDPLGDKTGAYLQGDLGHFEEPAWKAKLPGLGLVLPSLDVATNV